MAKYNGPDKRYGKSWNRLRFVIYKRDNYTCQICGCKVSPNYEGDKKANCHHIVPLGRGGTNRFDNLITLCNRCHSFIHGDYYGVKLYD